ncbi:MAG: hypothetical protein Q9182_006309 [Xanthomendoza sp. 2 TL-2023]
MQTQVSDAATPTEGMSSHNRMPGLGNHLAPGGYIEQAEINPVAKSDDGSVTPGDLYDQCGKLAIAAGNAFGKSLMIEESMQDDIASAGFIDVVKEKYKWPVGAWSNDPRLKELGRWNLIHWNQGMEGWTMRFCTKHLGWTYDAVKEWNAEMRNTLRDRKYHAYQDVYGPSFPSLHDTG